MNKAPQLAHVSCYSCNTLGFNLKKLISDKYICDECIDSQCTEELNQIESLDLTNEKQDLDFEISIRDFISRTKEHYRLNDSLKYNATNAKSIVGIKLFNIKKELAEFGECVNSYDHCIKNKLDIIKYEINQVYEINLRNLNAAKHYYMNLINNYEQSLFAKLKKSSSSSSSDHSSFSMNVFEFYSKHNEKNLKLFDKNYLTNELSRELELVRLGSNFELASDSIQKLKSIELKIDNYEAVLKSYIDQFYESVYSNKFIHLNERYMKSAINKLRKSQLNIGYLKFDKIEQAKELDTTLVLEDEDLDEHEAELKDSFFELDSIHIMDDQLIVFYRSKNISDNFSKLDIFDGSGNLLKKILIKEKRVYALKTSQAYLVICYTDISDEIKIAVFDAELELLCTKSIEYLVNPDNDEKSTQGKLPAQLFVENKRFYLLVVNPDLRQPIVFVFNLTIDLMNSFYFEENQFLDLKYQNNFGYLSLFHANNKLFLKQKSLYGSRLDMIDSIKGDFLDRLVINYFFDCFYIDSTASYLNFILEGRIYTYDLINKSMLNISYLNNYGMFLDKFCVNSNGFIFNSLFKN